MVARELDVKAALYLHEEELKREADREKRDRDFWRAMFGDKSVQGESLEDQMSESVLGTR
jgi:hypothetical protein